MGAVRRAVGAPKFFPVSAIAAVAMCSEPTKAGWLTAWLVLLSAWCCCLPGAAACANDEISATDVRANAGNSPDYVGCSRPSKAGIAAQFRQETPTIRPFMHWLRVGELEQLP